MMKLRELRKQRNMTQQELADCLGIQRHLLSYYETGKITPKTGRSFEIANFFGVTLEELYEGEFDGD